MKPFEGYSLKPLGLVYQLTDCDENTEELHRIWGKFRMRGVFEKSVFPKEDGLSTIMSSLPFYYQSILLNLVEHAYLYLSEGKIVQARDKIAIVESLAPESNYTHQAKGIYYIAVNELDKALTELDKAIKANRDDLLSIAWKGYVLSSKGELDKARLCYTKASELAKNDPGFIKKLNRIFSRGYDEYLRAKVSEKG